MARASARCRDPEEFRAKPDTPGRGRSHRDFTALADGAVVRGLEGFREFRRGSPWIGELAVEPEEFVTAGPHQVLVMVRVRSRAAAMGAELEATYAHLMTFRGDRVIRWKLFHDRAEARRAAGLDGG